MCFDVSELKVPSSKKNSVNEKKLDEKTALENSVKQIAFLAKQLKEQIDRDFQEGTPKSHYKIIRTLANIDWKRFNGKGNILEQIFVKAQKDVDSYLKSKSKQVSPRSLGAAAAEEGFGDPYEIEGKELTQEEIDDLYVKAKDQKIENNSFQNPDYDISSIDTFGDYENLKGKTLYANSLTGESMTVLSFNKDRKTVKVFFREETDKKRKNEGQIAFKDFILKLKKYTLDEKEYLEGLEEKRTKEKPTQKDEDAYESQSEVNGDGKTYVNNSVPEDAKEKSFKEDNRSKIKKNKAEVEGVNMEKFEMYANAGVVFWRTIEENTDWLNYEYEDKQAILLGMTKAYVKEKIKEDITGIPDDKTRDEINYIIKKIKTSL